MTREEAIKVLVDHAETHEHQYEDRGYDYSYCGECGWNSNEDGWGKVNHRPGCELKAAIDLLRGET